MRDAASVTRRQFLSAGAVAVAGVRFGGGSVAMLNSPQGVKIPGPTLSSVKALVFDTFGTVVDWRSSIAKEIEDLAAAKGSRWTARSSPTPGAAVMVRA
jgi:hypothetical protein